MHHSKLVFRYLMQNIPADSQRLIFNGKELDDRQLLRGYGKAKI